MAYMCKAQRTLATARLLLKEKDTEGACNRAYYAMFYAAHVALLEVSGETVAEFKSHSGLIGAFGKQVILGLKMNRASRSGDQQGAKTSSTRRLHQAALKATLGSFFEFLPFQRLDRPKAVRELAKIRVCFNGRSL
jgi:uncharacterized protein (UPF0332 family)